MLRMSSPYTSLSQATLWLVDVLVCGLLGIFILRAWGGKSYFNLEINIHQDNRPLHDSDRFETAEALRNNISGRYRHRITVPI